MYTRIQNGVQASREKIKKKPPDGLFQSEGWLCLIGCFCTGHVLKRHINLQGIKVDMKQKTINGLVEVR